MKFGIPKESNKIPRKKYQSLQSRRNSTEKDSKYNHQNENDSFAVKEKTSKESDAISDFW
jgi:hypothetical protein